VVLMNVGLQGGVPVASLRRNALEIAAWTENAHQGEEICGKCGHGCGMNTFRISPFW